MKILHAISYSPWSEKARWALDHHKIDYREVPFNPPLDEIKLRVQTRNWTGRISAPLFIDEARSFTDSWDIAKHADAMGRGATLFPTEHGSAIERTNDLSQRGLEAGRGLFLSKVLLSDEALRDLVPRNLARALGPLSPRVAAAVIRKTQRKWGSDNRSADEMVETLAGTLEQLRQELNGKPYLFGTFSYGDISAAQILGMVKPVVHPSFRMKSRARERFTVESLAKKYEDLVAWRDELYARHRSA